MIVTYTCSSVHEQKFFKNIFLFVVLTEVESTHAETRKSNVPCRDSLQVGSLVAVVLVQRFLHGLIISNKASVNIFIQKISL